MAETEAVMRKRQVDARVDDQFSLFIYFFLFLGDCRAGFFYCMNTEEDIQAACEFCQIAQGHRDSDLILFEVYCFSRVFFIFKIDVILIFLKDELIFAIKMSSLMLTVISKWYETSCDCMEKNKDILLQN